MKLRIIQIIYDANDDLNRKSIFVIQKRKLFFWWKEVF